MNALLQISVSQLFAHVWRRASPRVRFRRWLQTGMLAAAFLLAPGLDSGSGLHATPPELENLRALIDAGEWNAAESELKKLRPAFTGEQSFRNLEAHVLRARASRAYADGRLEEAARLQRSADALRYAGIREQIASDRFAEALQAIATLPDDEQDQPAVGLLRAEARIGQGEAAFRRSAYAKALEHFQAAEADWPNHPLVKTRLRELPQRIAAARHARSRPSSVRAAASAGDRSDSSRQTQNPAVSDSDAASRSDEMQDSSAESGGINIFLVDDSGLLEDVRARLRAETGETENAGRWVAWEARVLLWVCVLLLVVLNVQVWFRRRRE